MLIKCRIAVCGATSKTKSSTTKWSKHDTGTCLVAPLQQLACTPCPLIIGHAICLSRTSRGYVMYTGVFLWCVSIGIHVPVENNYDGPWERRLHTGTNEQNWHTRTSTLHQLIKNHASAYIRLQHVCDVLYKVSH